VSTITDVYEKKGGQLEFLVCETVVSRPGGELVATLAETIVVRHPAAAESVAERDAA
jgi:hypothetical protein